jgi:hypothetical protein
MDKNVVSRVANPSEHLSTIKLAGFIYTKELSFLERNHRKCIISFSLDEIVVPSRNDQKCLWLETTRIYAHHHPQSVSGGLWICSTLSSFRDPRTVLVSWERAKRESSGPREGPQAHTYLWT